MSELFHILLCEPDEADASSVIAHLESRAFPGIITRITRADDVAATLENGKWNLILCAQSQPELDARQILNIVRIADPDLPMIVLTNTASEASVATLMVAGVRDVIRKSDLARLLPVMSREIETVHLRRNLLQAADRAEVRFRNIVETSMQGIIVRANSKTQFVNRAFCEMFGYSTDEMMNLPSIIALHPQSDHEQIQKHVALRYAGDMTTYQYEIEGIRKDGSIFWCAKTASHVEWNGQLAVQVTVIDITERKKAEQQLAERERQYRETFENAPGAMIRSGHDRRIIEANGAFAHMLGYSKEEVIGLRVGDFVPKRERDAVVPTMKRVWAREIERAQVEFSMLCKDGRSIWVESTTRLTPGNSDAPNSVQMLAQFQDITRRHEAEIALTERETIYRHLVDKSLQGLLIIDLAGRALFANDVFAKMMGHSVAELVAMDDAFCLYPEEEQTALRRRMKSRRTGDRATTRYEIRAVHKNGTQIWLEQLTSTIEWQGQPAIQIAIIDITDRKHDAELLEARELKYRQSFENAPIAMFRIDRDRSLRDWNRAFEELLGYDHQELNGRTAHKLIHPDDSQQVRDRTKWVWDNRVERIENEYRMIRKDGTIIWVAASGCLTPDENGASNHLIVQLQDITARKQAEEERDQALRSLAQNERQYRELFEYAPVAIAAMSLKGDFIQTNWAHDEMLGYTKDEMMKMHPVDLVEPSQRDAMRQVLMAAAQKTTQGRVSHDLQLIHKNGAPVWAWLSGTVVFDADEKPSYILAHLQDITARKKAEAQLFQSQKMEALGNLAGGIAHDFNNMLLPIIGLTALSKEDLPFDSPIQENLDTVIEAAEKARRLVSQILTFSRQDQAEVAMVDISSCIQEAIALIRNILPSTITIIDRIERDVGIVLGDSAQIHSVILNLGSNAAHAMNNRVGELEIGLATVTPDADLAAAVHGLIAGTSYARVTMRDTGCGMDKETINKIFNPFFTTKAVGEGTGLGLSMVHGIIEGFNGAIHVSSEIGIGTKFEIYLPLQLAEQKALADSHWPLARTA